MKKNNLSNDEKEKLKTSDKVIEMNLETKKIKEISVDEHGFLKIKRGKLSSKKRER